jgi:undecaprenyl-diphosphatase
MEWIDALILGIVQGLSEYLPISSSGHLTICQDILGLNLSGADSLQFDVMLHVATVLSTIVVLWKEFVPLCTSFFTLKKDDNTRYVIKLIISAIPVGVVGLCFKDKIEEIFGSGLTIVGICLLVTAGLLSFSYYFRTRPQLLKGNNFRPHNISMTDAFIIGIAQAVAVLPGLSRSGSTIATGIIIGDKREQVASFSFFMVIIPILGEALLDLKKIFMPSSEAIAGTESIGWLPMAVGFIAAFVMGCLACKWMIELVKRGKLIWFAVYCAIVGILCILW